jgi:hypothetical protein
MTAASAAELLAIRRACVKVNPTHPNVCFVKRDSAFGQALRGTKVPLPQGGTTLLLQGEWTDAWHPVDLQAVRAFVNHLRTLNGASTHHDVMA